MIFRDNINYENCCRPRNFTIDSFKGTFNIESESYANLIRSVHKLAQYCITDTDSSSQLLVAVERLDDHWSSFVVENDTVLASLISLDLSSQYSDTLGVELYELITFSKPVARRWEFINCMKYCLYCLVYFDRK